MNREGELGRGKGLLCNLLEWSSKICRETLRVKREPNGEDSSLKGWQFGIGKPRLTWEFRRRIKLPSPVLSVRKKGGGRERMLQQKRI